MLLSIIVPTLNEEKYLPILLSSLVEQTNKKFEVIVSDGKSEDKTKEKALEFKDNLNIKIYESNKRHLAYQRNFGAQKAKGDYLIFIDADHWVNTNFIELIFNQIKRANAEMLIPVTIYYSKSLFWRTYSVIADIIIRILYFLFKKPFCSWSTAVIKKNIFEKIGKYDETIFYCEDQSLLREARKHNVQIDYSKDIKAYSSTRRMDKSGILKFFYIMMVAGFYLNFKGPIKKRIFEFEMGGQAHEITS